MLNHPTLSEKIIRSLSNVEEFFYLPKSPSQLERWFDRYAYRKEKRRRGHQQRMRKRVMEALKRLEKTSVLSVAQDSHLYRLTPKGWLRYLYYYSLQKQVKTKRKGKQTKKKYIIIFDIPEKHRRFRDLFRKNLRNQGCRMIQKSVFSCPNEVVYKWARKVVYNCELDGHVLFIEADRVD